MRLLVVHGCYDVASAEAELPLICAGQLDTPCQSGKGSNVDRPAGERRVPEIIYFGGVVSDEEVEKLTAAIQEKAPNARFVRIKREDVIAAGAPGPVPEVIAQIFRAKVASL